MLGSDYKLPDMVVLLLAPSCAQDSRGFSAWFKPGLQFIYLKSAIGPVRTGLTADSHNVKCHLKWLIFDHA